MTDDKLEALRAGCIRIRGKNQVGSLEWNVQAALERVLALREQVASHPFLETDAVSLRGVLNDIDAALRGEEAPDAD